MRKLFFSSLLLIFTLTLSAQDTLLLLSGRKLVVASVDLSNNTIAYRGLKPGAKLKTIDPERVFSVKYKDGRERIIYEADSLDPIDFKVEEMRNFIIGEQDSKTFYKNNGVKAAGAGIGGASALLAFYGIAIPAIYATVVGSFSPIIENKLTIDISGDAAGELGIKQGSYLNNVDGNTVSPVMKKDQVLKLDGKKFCFKSDVKLDSLVSAINSSFNCHRVRASNDNNKIKLFKSDYPGLINDLPYREGFEKKSRDYKIKNAMIYGLAGFVAGFITYKSLYKDDD